MSFIFFIFSGIFIVAEWTWLTLMYCKELFFTLIIAGVGVIFFIGYVITSHKRKEYWVEIKKEK